MTEAFDAIYQDFLLLLLRACMFEEADEGHILRYLAEYFPFLDLTKIKIEVISKDLQVPHLRLSLTVGCKTYSEDTVPTFNQAGDRIS